MYSVKQNTVNPSYLKLNVIMRKLEMSEGSKYRGYFINNDLDFQLTSPYLHGIGDVDVQVTKLKFNCHLKQPQS